MHGPGILVESLSRTVPFGPSKALWQYHSRSDRHSKVACWTVAFDLLRTSGLLRRHVEEGNVVFGLNHEMRDFSTGRRKDLDLVIARPDRSRMVSKPRALVDLVDRYGVVLTTSQSAELAQLPALLEGPVGAPLMALEAKACMTAHIKSLPRLYDELNSSHLTVHGASSRTLAVGLAMVNASPTFISPGLNKPGSELVISENPQPLSTVRTVAKLREIPRRSRSGEEGFDGFGIIVVSCINDGTPVTLVETPPAPEPGDVLHYEAMVNRVATEYDVTFGNL